MRITKNHLIEVIDDINKRVEFLISKVNDQNIQISNLLTENQNLKNKNQDNLRKIKGYIEELEQIRNYYVNSNNKSGK